MDGLKSISLQGLITFGFTILKTALIVVIGHYAVVFILKLLTKSFEKVKMDVSLE